MPAGRPPKYTSAEKMQDGYVEVDHLNCSGRCCGNPRKWENQLTMQERRNLLN